LVRAVFAVLQKNPDGLPAREVLDQVEKGIALTDFEKSYYPNRPNVRRFEKIVRFMTISSVKAGWMVKSKGVWELTGAGRLAYEKHDDPAQFMAEARRLYYKWKRSQPDTSEEDQETPGAAATLEEAEELAWTEIQSHLEQMSPYDFQDLVAGLLRGMKYHVSWVAPAGPDRGVDILAHRDPLGVQGGRIKVQVKRRSDKITVGEVRSFMALLGDDDVGIFVTTAGFTTEAETEARSQEKRRLMLLDAKRLFDLWVEYYSEIPEAQRRLLPLRAVHYLAPEE
jgi:restriction system protein